MLKRICSVLVLFLIMAPMSGCKKDNRPNGEVTIRISPKDVTLLLWEEETFTAIVTGLSDQRVTWSATGGTIDEHGRYLATEEGTFEVQATSKADPSKKATATVNVLSPRTDFPDVTAWQGTVNWKVSGSWSISGEAGGTWSHQINEDLTREYRLEDNSFSTTWRRLADSAVEVSGSIADKSTSSDGSYGEIKWSDSLTVVPDSIDTLTINRAAGTYTISLGELEASPIPHGVYAPGGECIDTWEDVTLEEILIANQPLPQTGTTLAGSKVEKRYIYPVWGDADASEAKELDVTITWSFVPLQ